MNTRKTQSNNPTSAHNVRPTMHAFGAILMAVLFVFAFMPGAQAALVTSGSPLDAGLLYYQPVPAQPGDIIDVYITVENNGGSTSKKGTLTFLESETFQLVSPSERIKNFPPIPGSESFLIKTKVRIAKNANEGIGLIRIKVQQDAESTSIDRNLEISITGKSSALSIDKVVRTPAEAAPGEATSLAITIKNIGDTEVRNVGLALDLTDVDFAPVSGSDSKTVRNVNGGVSHTFTFELVSFPETAPKAYQIPVTLSYDDETGNTKTQEETIGIVVGTTPELSVYFDRITMDTESQEGEVVIRFVNKGLAEIKLLEMQVQENDAVQVTSETSFVYVGNIDEDDYESATLSLKVAEKETAVPLRLQYRDSLNRQYTQDVVLVLKVPEAEKNSGGSKVTWIIGLVVVGLLIFWWRKQKQNKKR